MRGMKWIGTAALMALIAVPTFAGEGKKCSYGTQECLDHLAVKMKSNGWIGVELDVTETTGIYEITKIVDDSPALVAHRRIERLADGELRGIVGDELLHQRERIGPLEVEFAHV